MLFFILLSLGLLLFSFWGKVSWVLSFCPLGAVFLEFPFDFYFDKVGVLCVFMLLCCGLISLFYCYHYMGDSFDGLSLYYLMFWFLSVMCFLVLTGSVILSLIFWEYLGLVSFFLILFYSNPLSLRSSLITLVASRFGDVALFFIVMWSFLWFDFSYQVVLLFLFLVVVGKSASYPFISWLLEAMRAPTPVSSLVHSSTLVAAGVWFLFRYSSLFSPLTLSVLFLFSVVTILISGFCALFFNDLKKLVALSTCNNISWCLLFFVCGDLDLALLQLLTHGICKCYLFMSVGDLMGLSGGSQSSVGVYLSRYSGVYSVYLQFLLVMSLCGVPFLGVFFGKHLLFSEVFYLFGLGYILLFFVGLFLTNAYSFRLILLLLKNLGGSCFGYSSHFMLIGLLAVLGTLINFCGSSVLVENISFSFLPAVIMFLVQFFGGLCGWLLFIIMGEFCPLWATTLGFSDVLVSSIYDVYLWLSSISLISVYRWESYLIGLFPYVSRGFLLFGSGLFSFNIIIFSLGLFIFFWLAF